MRAAPHIASPDEGTGFPFVVRDEPARSTDPPITTAPRLLDQVRAAIRACHYSRRTESAYVAWIRRFVLFHGKRLPRDLGEAEVTSFLTSLAIRDEVAASTQTQALSALLFLYREVLKRDLDWLDEVVRAKRPARLPIVLSREQVAAIIGQLRGVEWIMGTLLYAPAFACSSAASCA